uniref:hypothetical protein n=1 Tax=Nonomuraea sp. SBT364 TaxID=1580530 RepID=UPI00066BE274
MILGLDAASGTAGEAEHLLHTVARALGLPAGTIGCTHFVRGGGVPHVACSLALPAAAPGPPALPDLHADLPAGVSFALGGLRTGPYAEGAAEAAATHAARSGGRVVTFPGCDRLTGTLTVADLLTTAIDEVTVLGGQPPDPATPVVTNDHIRPVWREGRLTLALMPAAAGRLTPAEVPNP